MRRRRLRSTHVFLVLGAVCLSATSTAFGRTVLSRPDAERHANVALHHKFGGAWDEGLKPRYLKCTQRLNRIHLRCQVAWGIGDFYWYGVIRIWLTRNHRGGIWWNYAYRIRYVNDYCNQVEHKSLEACSRILVVEWNHGGDA